jgi:hypothetical protein
MDDVFESEVLSIGKKLNSIGSLTLMKKAFNAFASYADWPPLVPKDLQKVWEGTGGWKA